jgi:hypothetical protein
MTSKSLPGLLGTEAGKLWLLNRQVKGVWLSFALHL